MNADETLKQMIRLGEELYGAVDLEEEKNSLLESLQNVGEKTRSRVESALDGFDESALDEAIGRLDQAQAQLLAGRAVGELSDAEITDYSELGNLKVVLAARRVRLAADGDALAWFVEDVWPVLRKVAPVLLTLLV